MPTVLIEKQTSQITVLTLNRPERRNALTIELLSELNAAIKIASDQPEERVIILRGAGAAFCTGLDLKEAADQTKAHATAEMVGNTLIAISQTRLITIAAVHGAAVAGGAGIMSACDLVVAAQGTKIGYPEVRRGLVAGLVMTFLRRQVGERNMRELLLGSELIDADRAREIGLVNRVVTQADLMNEAPKIDRRAVVQCGEGRCRSCAKVPHASARIGGSARRHSRVQREAKPKMGEVVASRRLLRPGQRVGGAT